MRKKEKKAVKFASALDVPLDFICDVPRIEMFGTNSLSVENFRGVLDYNETAVKVNTTAGILEIAGSTLVIESITDEAIMIKGLISYVRYV